MSGNFSERHPRTTAEGEAIAKVRSTTGAGFLNEKGL
jgi:hypothetical protein